MNGKAYYLGLKDRFPKADPLFVLVSLKPNVARIGVAGGAFSDGKTIPLAKGKKVTVVNDTTGTRYVLKARVHRRRSRADGELHPGREVRSMRRIVKDESGLGIVELVIAIAIINVAIMAMFAMFQAGALSVLRASRTSNGAVVAEKQAELYRAMLYKDIQLNDSLVAAAASDSLHTADAEWVSSTAQVQSSTCTSSLAECRPVQTAVTGADGRAYRVDTYVQAVTPASGRAGKQVTVVVRLASDTSRVLARLTTNYDLATGCTTDTTAAAALRC